MLCRWVCDAIRWHGPWTVDRWYDDILAPPPSPTQRVVGFDWDDQEHYPRLNLVDDLTDYEAW